MTGWDPGIARDALPGGYPRGPELSPRPASTGAAAVNGDMQVRELRAPPSSGGPGSGLRPSPVATTGPAPGPVLAQVSWRPGAGARARGADLQLARWSPR